MHDKSHTVGSGCLVERRLLRINASARRLGSWNCLVTLAAICLSVKLNRRATLPWLARVTLLSVAGLHGHVADLEHRGFVEVMKSHGQSWRRPTRQGLNYINRLHSDSFDK